MRSKWFRRDRSDSAGVNNTSPVTDGHPLPSVEKPPPVILTYEQILEAKCLCEASKLLIEREERLFGDLKESEALTHHEEEVNKLAADRSALEDLVLQTLIQSLSLGEDSLEVLTSAVKVVKQEEDQDQRWTQRDRTHPAWRPSKWRKLHDSTLHSLVEERMDNPSTPLASQGNQSTILRDINRMGRQLKEDLLCVVDVVKSCYPQEFDICNFYAKLYHQTLGNKLRNIADFGLVDNDRTSLLLWVNMHYPEILGKPQLASEIDIEALGKLLPKEILTPLEDEYLSNQQVELTTYIGRVLEEEKKKWTEGEEPRREDECYVSTVAYDIIQLINGMVTSATKVVGDLHKAQEITCPLKDSMHSFKIFQNDVMQKNKANSRLFIKATLSCIEQFGDVLDNKRDLFTEDVRKSCWLVLADMKQSAHTYLLKPVHSVLKPQYRKLGTSDWLNTSLFDELLVSIKHELQGLHGSTESCHQMLISQLHQEVSAEYVKRLLKGKVKLKDQQLQLKAYVTVKDNAESLHDLFVEMGSKEDWLKDILTKIAEVLKLQDLPAIQMQVVSLGTAQPDLSEKHVLALLKLKTNLSKNDRKTAKEILSDTLKEIGRSTQLRPFFSKVHVK